MNDLNPDSTNRTGIIKFKFGFDFYGKQAWIHILLYPSKTGYDSSEENNLICFHHLDRDLTLRKNLGPDSHFRKQNPNPTLQTNIDTGTKYKYKKGSFFSINWFRIQP